MRKKITLLVGTALATIAFLGSVSLAASPKPIMGFAWSDNIGWISFSSENTEAVSSQTYGVTLDDQGVLSGFAWSDNAGWVKFDSSLTGPAGATDSFGAKFVGSNLKGWARVCSATVNGDCTGATRSDGWDGWIGFSGLSSGGVHLEANKTDIKGYGWGSDVLGWLYFDLTVEADSLPEPEISATISANGKTGLPGNRFSPTESITLAWSSTGSPSECKVYNESNNNKILFDSGSFSSGDSFNGTRSLGTRSEGSYKFSITCKKPTFPDATAEVAFKVVSPLVASCSVSPTTVDLASNRSVTWTTAVSGGTAPYSYLWSGNSPLNGKTENPVSITYPDNTPVGFKAGQVSVNDSSEPPQTISQKDCSNGVTVSDSRCDFAFSANPADLTVNFVSGETGAGETNIKILATNCEDEVDIDIKEETIDTDGDGDPDIIITDDQETETIDTDGDGDPDIVIIGGQEIEIGDDDDVVIVVTLTDPETGEKIDAIPPGGFLTGFNLDVSVRGSLPPGETPIRITINGVGATVNPDTGEQIDVSRNIRLNLNPVRITPNFDEF